MSSKPFCAFLFFLSFILSACEQEKKPTIARLWWYDQSMNPAVLKGDESHRPFSGSFIDLQENGGYTRYFTRYDSGRWFLKDSTLILVNADRRLDEFKVRMKNDWLYCTQPNTGAVYRFRGYGNHFDSTAENPFSWYNNQWRIPARHKESDAELYSRLQNHFRFWEKYYAWGWKEKVPSLDVSSTPSILKLYGNAFELEYYEYQSPRWKGVFYDTADSYRIYEKLYYLMHEKDIDWPRSENRLEAFVSAFRQLQNWMDEKVDSVKR